MEREVRVIRVDAHRTTSGAMRFVAHTDDGGEYTTFDEQIARQAMAAEGREARIEFHDEQLNGSRKVFLDGIEPLAEVDWLVAVEAVPWLVGGSKNGPRRDGEE